MLAYKAKNGPAPPYLMATVKSRAVPRALRASSTARLEPPSLRTHGRQASRLFSVLAPRWWNELPLGVRTAESLGVFKRRLKTHLFVMHLRMSTGLGLPGGGLSAPLQIHPTSIIEHFTITELLLPTVCLAKLQQVVARVHAKQMSEPPQLAPLNVEE
ncbi:hypothetical protein NFI96_001493 [Prochilodus magdalenae]|nr:hypothetical protein NFI96_001493 [Prochilodus magdalenae]